MRFVRAYTNKATGELRHVAEQEFPFSHAHAVIEEGVELEVHELGLAEDFDAMHATKEIPCSPALHLFLRLERVCPVEQGAPAAFRVKAGFEHQVPKIHPVPTTAAAMMELARKRGGEAIPARVAHWLEFIGALSGDEMDRIGLARLPIATAVEFDTMRMRRDPLVGPRADYFKRMIRARAAGKET